MLGQLIKVERPLSPVNNINAIQQSTSTNVKMEMGETETTLRNEENMPNKNK